MEMLTAILGVGNAASSGAPNAAQSAQGAYRPSMVQPPAGVVAPNAPGQPGAEPPGPGQRMLELANTAAAGLRTIEHPGWAVLDKLAGTPAQRDSFAAANPQTMQFLRMLFQ